MEPASDLAATMDALAVDTWRRLELGQPTGLAPQEESITDHVLFELNQRFPAILVRKPNGHEESTAGADWEWWVGSREKGWLCLRIQAKRIYGKNYPELSHKVKGTKSRQIDLLLEGCNRPGYLPYHVFYSGWEENRFLRSGVHYDRKALRENPYFPHCSWPPLLAQNQGNRLSLEVVRLGANNPRWWGCSALSSYRVARLMDDTRRLKYYAPLYLQHAMPWSMLFSRPVDSEVPIQISDFIDLAHWRLLENSCHVDAPSRLEPAAATMEADFPEFDFAALESQRIHRPPHYVEMMLELRNQALDEQNSYFQNSDIPTNYVIVMDLSHISAADPGPYTFL